MLVFYPQATAERCTVSLLLNVDPIGLVRGPNRARALSQYVNDRPYVANSLMSVAMASAFGTALNGKSKERQERVGERWPLSAELPAIRCRAGGDLLERLFAPLGYTVQAERLPLDTRFPEWGESDIYRLRLEGEQAVQDLLSHLYVLIPIVDNAKHYYVGPDEVEKLLKKGERWLSSHPEKDLIIRRSLYYRESLVRQAMEALPEVQEDAPEPQAETDQQEAAQERQLETPIRLNDARMEAALGAVRSLSPSAQRVLDLGCGEGRLLRLLMDEPQVKEIAGVDVAARTLQMAARKLKLERLPDRKRERIRLFQGSAVYRDDRFSGFDVALLVEVIEHIDPARLPAMEGTVFGHARPRRVVITTPNSEANALWPSLPAGKLRHRDHRFEWTRPEFHAWAERAASRYGYGVTFHGIGEADPERGCPTQMAVFTRE